MYKIRLATVEDVEALVSLRMAFLKEVGNLGRLGSDIDCHTVEEAIRDYLMRKLPTGEFLSWVAEGEGDGEGERQIVGTGGISFLERPPSGTNIAGVEAYLSNMYTVPDWRNKGVATAIIWKIIAHMKETQVSRIWLHATTNGRPIYERAGFVVGETDMELRW